MRDYLTFNRDTISLSFAGGNVIDINTADILFILQDHDNENHKLFNTEVIRTYCDAREDVILVEEDSTKLSEELSLGSIPSINRKSYQIEGWDDHESNQKIHDFYASTDKTKAIAGNFFDGASIKYAFQELLLAVGTLSKRNKALVAKIYDIMDRETNFKTPRKIFALVGKNHLDPDERFLKLASIELKQAFSHYSYVILNPSKLAIET